MRLKIASLSAVAALVAACGSNTDECVETHGHGHGEHHHHAVVAGSVEDFVVNVGDRVFFDFDIGYWLTILF